MAEWLDYLARAVASHPRRAQGVAEELGYKRSAVSMVLAGKYPAKTDRIAARVLAVYAVHDCPALGECITQTACRAYALRPAPISSPRDLRHWRTCQTCAQHPHPPKE